MRAAQGTVRQNERVDRALNVSRETFDSSSIVPPDPRRVENPGERWPAHGGNLAESFPEEFA